MAECWELIHGFLMFLHILCLLSKGIYSSHVCISINSWIVKLVPCPSLETSQGIKYKRPQLSISIGALCKQIFLDLQWGYIPVNP